MLQHELPVQTVPKRLIRALTVSQMENEGRAAACLCSTGLWHSVLKSVLLETYGGNQREKWGENKNTKMM